MKTNSKNDLVKLISICGQIAEHKSEKMQEHNMDEANIYSALNVQEQEQLQVLLNKLKTKWIADKQKMMREKNNK